MFLRLRALLSLVFYAALAGLPPRRAGHGLLLCSGIATAFLAIDDPARAHPQATQAVEAHASETLIVEFPNEFQVQVPEPRLHAEWSAAQKAQVLDEISGKIGWKRFSAAGVNTPVAIDIQEISGEKGARLGYVVRTAYVLYAERERLANRDLLESSFGKPKRPDDPQRKLNQLAMRTLDAGEIGRESKPAERWVWMELPLLKKILIRTMLTANSQEQEKAFALSWRIAPESFEQKDASDKAQAKYHSRWSKLSTTPLGKVAEGESHDYTGLGGRMQITATDQGPNQWLVESHMVIHEPVEWFGEGKYLRTKLAPALQESAKSFRRKLR